MKEIGKLLELLNEYSKNIGYFNEEDLQGQTKDWILSKEFGWLKWLVENDKVKIGITPFEWIDDCDRYEEYEKIIMALSISDTPIEDLISYLR